MSDSYGASAPQTGLSSLRDEAACASSPKASIPSAVRPVHGGFLDAKRHVVRRPIMLEMAAADEQAKLQQLRLAFLREWFKDEVVHFADAGGAWTILDFFAYAAEVIGEPAQGIEAAPADETGTGSAVGESPVPAPQGCAQGEPSC